MQIKREGIEMQIVSFKVYSKSQSTIWVNHEIENEHFIHCTMH